MKKRLSKGVQRPFKRRVRGTIFVGPGKWSKTVVFRAFQAVFGIKKAAFGRPYYNRL